MSRLKAVLVLDGSTRLAMDLSCGSCSYGACHRGERMCSKPPPPPHIDTFDIATAEDNAIAKEGAIGSPVRTPVTSRLDSAAEEEEVAIAVEGRPSSPVRKGAQQVEAEVQARALHGLAGALQ